MKFPYRIIDLTHPIKPGGATWFGDPTTRFQKAADLQSESYSLNAWTIGEHTGTHVGAPSHFLSNGQDVGMIQMEKLILALSVISLAGSLRSISSYSLQVQDLQRDEEEKGIIALGGAVVLNSGWSSRWSDTDRVFERDSKNRYIFPGFSIEAAQWLYSQRKICTLGTDAPGIDPGNSTTFTVGKFLAETGGLHLENLANVDHIPPRGGWIVIGALPLTGGSGSPARVFALLPKSQ